MGDKEYATIPRTLLESITFLARALPIRSVPTFIELLVGAMITPAGFVTEAWLAIKPLRSWTAYYKWLQQGKWSWVALGVQLAGLVVTFFPQPVWYLIFDDTLVYRASKKAPGSAIYRQHGAKTNRPKYARGQCWVSMAPSIGCGMTHAAVPLLSRLMRPGTTRTKLDAAVLLLKIVAPVFNSVKACTLVDSWYMKRLYLDQAETLGFHSIGQVRRDTALYDAPTPKRGRGRPRKYGDRYTAARVALLPEHRQRDFLYGKWQWVRYRSTVCLARFLKGRKVRAVWMQFESEEGFLSKSRLPQLLATYCGEQVQPLLGLTPWRKKDQVTAGLVRLGLQLIFGNVRIRSWWNPKWRKFQHPEHGLEDVNLSKPPDCVVSKNKMTKNTSSTVSRTIWL
ncbi:MAG: transposase [Desulfoprunum sp.]|uniref:IS701 family transposase n=1 Tax=Desulfoprunum sp. TaxID=2020866 RepID=UPI003C753D0E